MARTWPRCQTVLAVGLVIFGTQTSWGFGVATAAAPEARAATPPRRDVIIVVFIVTVGVSREWARWSAMLDGMADQPHPYIRIGAGHEWDLGTWKTY
jgi:hypothetical protein